MKKTTLSILLFSTLFACGETTHTHNLSKTRFFDENTHWLTCSMCNEKISQEAHNIVNNACTICDYKIEFSEEENYQEWIKGINFTLNYQGAYTTNENRKSYFNNSLKSESHANESKENNKFFLDYSSYELNENNNIELKENNIIVIKTVLDNSKERNKYYNEITTSEGTKKEGYYVSPTYADNFKNFYSPQELLDGCYLEVKDTYIEFVNHTKSLYLQEDDIEPSEITLTRNNDNSLSLKIKLQNESVYDYIKEENYQKTLIDACFTITTNNQKISSVSYECSETFIYLDKKDIDFLSVSSNIDYQFDEKKYNSFSIETETTENHYYGQVNFFIEGQEYRSSDYSCLVEDKYSVKDAINFLLGSPVFIINANEQKDFLKVYIDEQMQQEFITTTMLENLTLYVKFKAPQDKAIVVCFFECENYTKYEIAYLFDLNTIFYPNIVFEDYPVLKINDTEIKEGEDTSFVCSENKTYYVTYNAKK